MRSRHARTRTCGCARSPRCARASSSRASWSTRRSARGSRGCPIPCDPGAGEHRDPLRGRDEARGLVRRPGIGSGLPCVRHGRERSPSPEARAGLERERGARRRHTYASVVPVHGIEPNADVHPSPRRGARTPAIGSRWSGGPCHMTGMDGSSHDRRDPVARRRAGGPLALMNEPLGTGYVRRSTEASKQGNSRRTVTPRALVQ